jgi:ethanolamine utilization protein EutQ (cupin superfamily)
MSDNRVDKLKTVPFAVFGRRAVANPQPGAAEVHMHAGPESGTSLGGGIAIFNAMDSGSYTVEHDEFLFVLDIEGELEIDHDGVTHSLAVGDTVWIASGSVVTYRAIAGAATMFFALRP